MNEELESFKRYFDLKEVVSNLLAILLAIIAFKAYKLYIKITH